MPNIVKGGVMVRNVKQIVVSLFGTRNRSLLATLVLCGLFLVLPTVALATVNQYFGPSWWMNPSESAWTGGFAVRDNNILYRPSGTYGGVQYNDHDDGIVDGAAGYDNPVEIYGSGVSVKSGCGNLDTSATYPTTCQTAY
jgi:hypothetical protein